MNYIDAVARQIEAELADTARPTERGTELYRLYALLALVKGTDVSLRDVHDAWSVWKADSGHESLIHFEELDTDTRELDRPYAEAIRRVARTIERLTDRVSAPQP